MVYSRISAFIPSGIREAFAKEIDYLGINIESGKFVGFIFSFGLALSLGIALNLQLFYQIPFLLSFALFASLFIGGIYVWLSITAESKGKFVEKILPDALQLIASNIRSGLTTERALLVSARPEFGPLEEELRKASKRILTGTPIQEALSDIPKRINSKTVEKTIWLVNKGVSSGGQIADVLTQLSDDLREQNSLQDEIRANISIYVMLIFFSAAIGSPIMLGISSFIVQILHKQISGIQTVDTSRISAHSKSPFSGIPKSSIDPDFVLVFAELSLLVTTIFASMTMGIINTGNEKNGLKYFPALLIVSFGIFLAIRFVLFTMFKAMV
ncbi:MAG: type II secretion system F family protein [Candidatus Diapherotrites archaeon]|nr:type II secretion system F family protein [Candidatus Diapherotrites archaeon]